MQRVEDAGFGPTVWMRRSPTRLGALHRWGLVLALVAIVVLGVSLGTPRRDSELR